MDAVLILANTVGGVVYRIRQPKRKAPAIPRLLCLRRPNMVVFVHHTASLECRGLGFMAILQTHAVTVITLAGILLHSGDSDELLMNTGREGYMYTEA